MPNGKGPLRIAIEDFIESLDLSDFIWKPVKGVLEKLEDEAITLYKDIANESGLEEYLPSWLQQGSFNSRVNPRPVQIVPIVIGIAMMVIGMLVGVFAPAQRLGMYKVDKIAQSGRPSPLEIMLMARRARLSENIAYDYMHGLGFTDEVILAYKNLAENYLTAIDYVALLKRGAIAEGDFMEKMIDLGYNVDSINQIRELGNVIPPINDLIRMQVRESFRDDIASRYGYDEGDTDYVKEWASKQGLSPDWVQKYWRAHWELPSVSQVFEMLHRLRPGTTDNPVTTDEVNQFLGLADYAPGWRERLTAISYAPFTRVDVRRMYKTGVLTETQVKDAYLDLGYNDEKAQALTSFTIAYEAEEETGVVRSSVTSAYNDGMIDRGTAEGMLVGGGYDGTTVAFYLDAIDFKHSLDIKNIKLQNIKKRYVEGLIDEPTVNNEIGPLNLPAERVTALLELWTTERENQVALLSITQMETLLEMGVVTEDDYRRIATRRGYSDETIKWTLDRIAIEANNKAQSAAEKAQTDDERLQKSKTSTTYQKDKSELDLFIAQARAEITDIDVALHGDVSAEDETTLKARKDELKQLIATVNVAKAQLRFDTTTTIDKLGAQDAGTTG